MRRSEGGRWGGSWRRAVATAWLVLGVVACTGGEAGGDEGDADPAPPVTTERQRDSILGESALPGARGVRRARQLADSADARYRGLDTIGG